MRSSIWRKAFAVLGGVVLLAAVGVLLYRVKDLAPGYARLHVFMDDAAGLMDGTQVRLNGIPIGYLEGQTLTNSRDLSRKVQFDLRVRVAYLREIPIDSLVGLASDNLLGDQYIGIRRGKSPEFVQEGAELATAQNQDITRMMAQMSRQLERLQAVVERADKLTAGVGSGAGLIGRMVQGPKLKAGAGVSAEVDQLTADVQHGRGTVTKLLYEDPLGKQLESPLKRLEQVTASANDTSAKLKDFQADLDRATNEFKALQTELKSGQGSLAKIDQLKARMDELSVKIDGMVDKVNSGQGTIGQLLVNPQLNEALAGTTREFQELAKGLRTNPRKFIVIKIF